MTDVVTAIDALDAVERRILAAAESRRGLGPHLVDRFDQRYLTRGQTEGLIEAAGMVRNYRRTLEPEPESGDG